MSILSANDITCQIISEIENNFFAKINHFIALEVPFNNFKRRADILVINNENNKSTIFEIKSDLDNLLKLKDQVIDYNNVFDYIYIVTTPKHINNIENLILPNTGVILIKNEEFIIIKKATLSAGKNYKMIESTCQHKLELKTKSYLRESLCCYFKKKYENYYKTFKEETTTIIEELDILILRKKMLISLDVINPTQIFLNTQADDV